MRFATRWRDRCGQLSLIVVISACAITGCAQQRSDLLAANTSDTGPYEVLSQQEREPGVLVVRVKVGKLAEATGIAADLVLQKVNHGYRSMQFDILGPDDAANAAPRLRLVWPDQIDYTRP